MRSPRKFSYPESIKDDNSNFHPNESSPLSLLKENWSCGRQGTVNHMIMIASDMFDSCWATRAQAPNPPAAHAMPMAPDGMIAPRLLKKSFLNIMWREMYASWMELIEPRKSNRERTLRMGVRCSL